MARKTPMCDDILFPCERDILEAHANEDKPALANMYAALGKGALIAGDKNQAAFFYTQAYVYGLDCGAPSAVSIREILVSLGSEPASP